MTGSQIRTTFLDYFKKNGHTVVDSSSLVPSNDPTLLFTNSGMVQFKDVFLGKDPRPYKRATTSQKSVRAGGKHNDLENVGFTARHHTFFEMLGNFSFGDYFKKDAIHYAWDLILKEFQLPKDKLYVTVFREDDEAADIWHKQEGVPKDRIFRFDEKDNFWSMGDTGPCGPCTEIFFDRGVEHGCGKPTCKMGCDCDRYMEFWNLVFMQYDRDSSGKMTPLPKPSVDTGAGLERLASILQNAATNYDTDLFTSIMDKASKLAKRAYDPKNVANDPGVFSFRVIADHSRATTFLVGDGVMPSNEGRGYVLRRIMRRAIRHGRKLGFEGPFLYKTCGYVIDQMKGAYPDLVEKRAFIERAVQAEEEQFFKTLDRGLGLLDDEIAKVGAQKKLSGAVAFSLYDTYGFPLDLTRTICDERGLTVDEASFESSMEKQREESRKHWKGTGDQSTDAQWYQLASELKAKNQMPEFVGYDHLQAEGKCVAVFPGDVTQAVFSRTPFYAESGGQVGDRGSVVSVNGSFHAEVLDVTKPVSDLIVVNLKVNKGTLKVGDIAVQQVSDSVRAKIASNHTATHLLHWALREVLGKHVKQAGSLVTPDLLRFDFSHFQAMTLDELNRVETMINEKIWDTRADQTRVQKRVMNKEQAVAAGAIAFFGEKYGDEVRVISVGDYSTELCGGTHVDRSSDIHLFKIASEAGIAAGVRRIIAHTAQGAFHYLREQEELLKKTRDQLGASSVLEIANKVDRLFETEKMLKKDVERYSSQEQGRELDVLLKDAQTKNGVRVISALVSSAPDGMKKLREMADKIKNQDSASVAVLGVVETGSGKPFMLVAVGQAVTQKAKGVMAGEIIKHASPIFGGKGGGKPDFAQAGGQDASKLQAALDSAVIKIHELL